MLCGKMRCPILVRYYAKEKTEKMIDGLTIDGSSPPGVFVGRFGYPTVNIGPLVPPMRGDTRILDTPENWLEKKIDEIVAFRMSLVRGLMTVRADRIYSQSKLLHEIREMTMSISSPEVEAKFVRKPRARLILDDDAQPFGPSAPIKKLNIGNFKVDNSIEKVYYDDDLKAADGVWQMYQNGVLISRIQRVFSVGITGLKRKRKLVPTRWSITAVDDIIGKRLRENVKNYNTIDEYRIYESWKLDNRFIVLMMPETWKYELIEAWYPNTVWNPRGSDIMMISSSEDYQGRKTYAEIGGCYYAARAATCEFLSKIKRQSGVIILREAHPGYIMPVGVWNVRENVRNAFREEPKIFDSLNNALKYISKRLEIPLKRWIFHSRILSKKLHQRKLEEFYGNK